jgi:hypothetical protein
MPRLRNRGLGRWQGLGRQHRRQNDFSVRQQRGSTLTTRGDNLGGKSGIIQGIIVVPNGDVSALDFGDDKVVHLPNGDPTKAKFFCDAPAGTPSKDVNLLWR